MVAASFGRWRGAIMMLATDLEGPRFGGLERFVRQMQFHRAPSKNGIGLP